MFNFSKSFRNCQETSDKSRSKRSQRITAQLLAQINKHNNTNYPGKCTQWQKLTKEIQMRSSIKKMRLHWAFTNPKMPETTWKIIVIERRLTD